MPRRQRRLRLATPSELALPVPASQPAQESAKWIPIDRSRRRPTPLRVLNNKQIALS